MLLGGLLCWLDFYKHKEIKRCEVHLLCLYRQYTIVDDTHCCTVSDDEICDYLHMSKRTLRRKKKHLKELGYIQVDGVKVIYTPKEWDSMSLEDYLPYMKK